MSMAFLQEDDDKNTEPRMIAWDWGVTGKIPSPPANIHDIETQAVPVVKPQDQEYMLPRLPLVRSWEHGILFTRRANTLVARTGAASLSLSLVEMFRQYYKAYRDVPFVYLSPRRLQEAMRLHGKEAQWYQRYLIASHKVDDDTIVAIEKGITWA